MKPLKLQTILPALLMTIGLLIAGCGFKGELYLPGKDEKNQSTSQRPAS
ncbi:MAG: lipoprotein [Magnetococcales bacterium]|nr:lipoprotein [Magnetococcales bacterium]